MFGATPWGRAWVRVIEPTTVTAPNAALPKARSLARNMAVTLATGTGRVRADVTVSGKTRRVRIDLPPWSEQTRAEVERLVAEALADNRGLAAGDLPDALEADLAQHGISVAVPLGEQVTECDCRARRRPCADILATLYTLAQNIDERPIIALELRSPAVEFAAPEDPGWISSRDIDVATFYES